MDAPYGEARFPTTHWSLVARAGRDATEVKRQALGELLVRYLPALRAHLVYGKRLSPEDADDLLQDSRGRQDSRKELDRSGRRPVGQVPHLGWVNRASCMLREPSSGLRGSQSAAKKSCHAPDGFGSSASAFSRWFGTALMVLGSPPVHARTALGRPHHFWYHSD